MKVSRFTVHSRTGASVFCDFRTAAVTASLMSLILVGLMPSSSFAKPSAPNLMGSVVSQECTPTNDVNVTLTATLTPPKPDATYVWDFNNDGVFDTSPSTEPTVSHVYTAESTFTAVVGVMKGSQLKDTASVTFTTPICQDPWSIQYMSKPRYDIRTATFASDAVFVTDSWERYDTLSNSWSNGLLSDTRTNIAVAQSTSKAYFAGGKKGPYTDPVYVSSVDIYDDVSHLWSTASLSTAREVGAAGSVGGKLIFAGGRSAITMYKIVDIFDATTGRRSKANLAQARTNIAVGSSSNKIVFAGGWYFDFNFNQVYSNIADIYDAATGLWTRSTMSQKRDTISVASVGNKILFAGGLSDTGVSRNVDIYDVSTGSWTTAYLSVPRYAATVNVMGSKAYFAGSADGVPTVDVYDSMTNTWSVLTMPDTLVAMSGAVIGNQIFYAGGYAPATYVVSNAVQIYDTVSATWSSSNLSEARAGIGLATFADRTLFAGGLTKVTYPPLASATVDIYSVPTTEISGPITGHLEQYGTSSTGVALRWTAFEPKGGGSHPAVLVLHPGGFKAGAAGPPAVAKTLAGAGFFALATEYRLAPPHTQMNTPQHPPPSQNSVSPIDDGLYPEQTTDVQMAIRAARHDPRCNGLVYCIGGSAGASHSAYMAATGTPGDDMPDLIVCLSGVYDFADLEHLETPCVPGETCFWEGLTNYLGIPDFINHLPELAAAAPITYVTGNFPPAFLMVSSNDASQLGLHDFPQMLAKLDSVGITESTASYPEAGHYKQWVVPVGVDEVKHAFEY